jgi:hypothetical protein
VGFCLCRKSLSNVRGVQLRPEIDTSDAPTSKVAGLPASYYNHRKDVWEFT